MTTNLNRDWATDQQGTYESDLIEREISTLIASVDVIERQIKALKAKNAELKARVAEIEQKNKL